MPILTYNKRKKAKEKDFMTIKELRQQLQLSQPKLAKALGIGVSTIGGYETGRISPSDKVVAKIKETFGVDLNAIATAVEEKAAAVIEEEKAVLAQVEKEAAPAEKEAAPAEKKAPAKPKRAKKAAAPAAEKKAAPAEKKAKAPAEKKEKPARAKKVAAKIVIQSVMGGEIAIEDILAKVGDVDTVYVKPEENAAYWVKGDQSGAVNLW